MKVSHWGHIIIDSLRCAITINFYIYIYKLLSEEKPFCSLFCLSFLPQKQEHGQPRERDTIPPSTPAKSCNRLLMASHLSCTIPNLIPLPPSPFTDRTKTSNSLLLHPTHLPKPLIPRGSLCVARFGLKPGFFPDPDKAEAVIKDLFGRAESIVYTIADAAVSNSDQVVDSSTTQNSDWLSGITYGLESTLKVCLVLFFCFF